MCLLIAKQKAEMPQACNPREAASRKSILKRISPRTQYFANRKRCEMSQPALFLLCQALLIKVGEICYICISNRRKFR